MNLIIKLLTIVTTVLVLQPAFAAPQDEILSKKPNIEAEKANAIGDQRYIVVPMCSGVPGEVLPGWPLDYTPAHLEALENGKRPFKCDALKHEKQMQQVLKWAEKYNAQLLRLQNKKH